ncbi:hypothetical protein BZG36_03817 [Bifiguratus adelaidae]|uniref:DNA damage-binding protein 1 n=1 Tax=Bifiguratus adelaidae TaxID=1938954 RepID=A0A261XZM0_9FUNG|nr:hypothetical protein BZG36_03817 [Bifiguratus adelaidae]
MPTTEVKALISQVLQPTAIQHVRCLALLGSQRDDVVYGKENSLELLKYSELHSTLKHITEQPVFGTIRDIQVLRCTFRDDTESVAPHPHSENHALHDEGKGVQHVPIEGNDVLIATSDSGKLSFLTFSPYGSANNANELLSTTSSAYDASREKGKLEDPNEDDYSATRRMQKYGRFCVLKQIRLGNPGVGLKDPGAAMAVDPLSRAIAIAAFQDTIQVLFLKSTFSRRDFRPLKEKRTIHTEGTIFAMAFLYPNSSDHDRMLLAVAVHSDVDNTCRIKIYQFYQHNTIPSAYGRLPISSDSNLPLSLVALPKHPETFLLFTESKICIITSENVINGNVNYYSVNLRSMLQGVDSGSDDNVFMTVALADDSESDAMSSSTSPQRLYAGTPSGRLYRIDVIGKRKIELIYCGKGSPIGRAMTVIRSNSLVLATSDESMEDAKEGVDSILYSGEGASGELTNISLFPLRRSKALTIRNEAPILSCQAANDMFNVSRNGHYIGAGLDKHGSMLALQRGIPVKILQQSDQEWDGVTYLNAINGKDSSENSSLVVSFTSETKVMFNQNGELEDVSSLIGFSTDVSTVFSTAVTSSGGTRFLLQVHPSGLVVVPEEELSSMELGPELEPKGLETRRRVWNLEGNATIQTAAACDDHIIISVNDQHQNHLIAVDIATEVSDPSDAISFSHRILQSAEYEISFLTASRIANNNVLLVGTYQPSLMMFSFSNGELALLKEVDLAPFATSSLLNVPQSGLILANEEQLYLLIGLREGTVLYYPLRWRQEVGVVEVGFVRRRVLGTTSVTFVGTENPSMTSTDSTLALSSSLWKVTMRADNLAFDQLQLSGLKRLQAIIPFSLNPDVELQPTYYLVISDGRLYVIEASERGVHTQKFFSLSETPRRMLELPASNTFLVTSSTSENAFSVSTVRIIDLATKDIIWQQKFREREVIFSAAQWDYSGQYVCMGFGMESPATHAPVRDWGRLALYRLGKEEPPCNPFDVESSETKSTTVVLKEVWQTEDTVGLGPVTSLHCIGDCGDIIAGAGDRLLYYRFQFGTLALEAVERLRFLITSISVCGNRVAVSTNRDSVVYYDVRHDEELRDGLFTETNYRFEFRKTDSRVRLTHNVLLLTKELAIGTDKTGGIFGLLDNVAGDYENSLDEVFCFHLGEFVTRLTLVQWRNPHPKDTRMISTYIPWDATPQEEEFYSQATTQLEPNLPDTLLSNLSIMATTALGSIYIIDRISLQLYQLLSPLQQTMATHPLTRPVLGNDYERYRNQTGIAHDVIDGLLVYQFLRLLPSEQKMLISASPNLKGAIVAFSKTGQHGLLGQLLDVSVLVQDISVMGVQEVFGLLGLRIGNELGDVVVALGLLVLGIGDLGIVNPVLGLLSVWIRDCLGRQKVPIHEKVASSGLGAVNEDLVGLVGFDDEGIDLYNGRQVFGPLTPQSMAQNTQMQYLFLGNTGLKVSAISLGGWLTYGGHVEDAGAHECMKAAYEAGINFFDTAEGYEAGESEKVMGAAIKKFGWKRKDLVISTKIYWGGNGPNDRGLSRKHLIEGLNNSLERLGLDYVDIVYAHRPDKYTPLEETVRAFNHLIDTGKALYWGTSEWSAEEITRACLIAKDLRMIGPVVEQPLYNLLHRERVEKEYAPLYEEFGFGITNFSPIHRGFLSGKYNGIKVNASGELEVPKDSRLATSKDAINAAFAKQLLSDEGKKMIKQCEDLKQFADELGCTQAQFALAWCLKHPNVASVITGASRPEQIAENCAALQYVDKIDQKMMDRIDEFALPTGEHLDTKKAEVIVHDDYTSYPDELKDKLMGAEGCIWAQGISQTQVTKDEYIRITYDYPLAAAKAFSSLSNTGKFNFVYVSGEGADPTEKTFTLFGKIKGRAEIALLALPSTPDYSALRVYNVRPGFADPSLVGRGSMSHRAAEVVLAPLLRRFLPNQVSPVGILSKGLVNLATGDGNPLPAASDIEAGGRTLRSAAIRRLGEE